MKFKKYGIGGYRSLCLLHAKQALYHLSYYPNYFFPIINPILNVFNEIINAEYFIYLRLRYISIKSSIIIATAKQENINI